MEHTLDQRYIITHMWRVLYAQKDITVAEFYVFTRTLDGVIVGDSGLCCCILFFERCYFPLLILHRRFQASFCYRLYSHWLELLLFQKIREPFLEAVKITLGDRYTENMESIYKVAITFILQTMSEGMADALAEFPNEES